MVDTPFYDFRDVEWADIAATLTILRERASITGVYAYVRTSPGMQTHMVKKLVLDLDLLDHVCFEGWAAEGVAGSAIVH